MKGIKREKPLDAIERETEGQGKEVCVEKEEMRRVKYQGVTITHYEKGGTLCIQVKEADVMKIKAHQTDEENEAEDEGEKEERAIRKNRTRERKGKGDKQKDHRYGRRRRNHSQKAGRDEAWNKHTKNRYIKGAKDALGNNNKEEKNREEEEQKADTDRDTSREGKQMTRGRGKEKLKNQ